MEQQAAESFPFVIVGGGISGLLVASLMKRRGVRFLGIEKAEVLGGRTAVGHHRVYTEEAVTLLSETLPTLVWDSIAEAPVCRRKGEWVDFGAIEGFERDEQFYLRRPYFTPHVQYRSIVEELGQEVVSDFVLRRTVTAVFPTERKIHLQDGRIIDYEKLVWCTGLTLLNKVWEGDRTPIEALMKKGSVARGGVDLEWELSTELMPNGSTMVFPFRFKEHKLRALGTQERSKDGRVFFHLMLFLDPEINDDREEVAKCLRALRREFEKEFPLLKQYLSAEKIAYMIEVSGEVPSKAKSLEVFPNLYYVGPQVAIGATDQGLENLDLVTANCRHLEKALWDSR